MVSPSVCKMISCIGKDAKCSNTRHRILNRSTDFHIGFSCRTCLARKRSFEQDSSQNKRPCTPLHVPTGKPVFTTTSLLKVFSLITTLWQTSHFQKLYIYLSCSQTSHFQKFYIYLSCSHWSQALMINLHNVALWRQHSRWIPPLSCRWLNSYSGNFLPLFEETFKTNYKINSPPYGLHATLKVFILLLFLRPYLRNGV